jgi:F0F1-type ATP synthase membrane subunit b/b'
MSAIDDETKQEIVDAYLKAEPTPENSMDIVNDLAEELGKSANSIRMILSNAGVYVKKTAKAATPSKTSDSDEVKTSRKSKQSSIDDLSEAIRAAGQEVDDAIVSKLTGKAAEYFNSILRSISK